MEVSNAPVPRSRYWWPVAGLVAVLAVFGWAKVRDAAPGPDVSAPSCSWPAHIEHANSDQAGLVRCYLRALAHRSASELRAVVRSEDDNGPTGFSSADLAHSADARSGAANVTVTSSDVDGADAAVSIRYADGAHDEQEIHLADPSFSQSWCFWDIGTYASDSAAPPTAGP